MPATYSYPGVYIQELPSPVHTIAGVATSIVAFVGYTARGIDDRAQAIFSFSDFERLYGGLASDSELSYAVAQFFQNGGTQAYVVRVKSHGATASSVTFNGLTFTALSTGAWTNGQLLIDVDLQNIDLSVDDEAFNLTVTDLADQTSESFPNVTLNASAMNYVSTVINDPDNGSRLVKVEGEPTAPVTQTGIVGSLITNSAVNKEIGGTTSATEATKDFGLSLSTSAPAPLAGSKPVPVTVLAKGAPIPQSMAGLAAQLQQTVNQTLSALSAQSEAGLLVGASVVVTVTEVPGGGQALRVSAQVPGFPDAVLALEKPSPGGDAGKALGLNPSTVKPNVAHYALGTGHGAAEHYEAQTKSVAGTNGPTTPAILPQSSDLIGEEGNFTGIYALLKVPSFNMLSIPDATRAKASSPSELDSNPAGALNPVAIYNAAITLCDKLRAFLLVDPPPEVTTVSGAIDWKSYTLGITDSNGAAFWPRPRLPDPLNNYSLRTFAPSGIVAGAYAASDTRGGVWTAPAGIQASLNGVQSMTYQLSDQENGQLNPLGLNCLRTFPVIGPVLWGARTLAGADVMTSQWKYVPVRRMALFLESSLYQGTQWVVFQPNDEPLWAAIRLNVGSFMQTYFLKGAFQGQTPDQAYFVKCDGETTTQTDIDNGVVNILVGFAPLQPAEFVVIQIEQLTGQAQS
jgi:phage tail sheath protein FI